MNPTDAAPPPPEDAPTPRRRRWWQRTGFWTWVVLLGFVLVVQWPMFKGWYYQHFDPAEPASAVAWRADAFAAFKESQSAGKPVLLDFTASWCPPCNVMKHETWPDDTVAAAVNAGYIPVKVDVDDPKNEELSARYGIRTIPTILVLDADGKVLREGSYMSADQMVAFLKRTNTPS